MLGSIIEIVLNSLVLGGVFLIVAIGLNIIYGLNRVMNLAHGSLYALGAYFGWTLGAWGANFFVAMVLAPALVGAVGILLERGLIAPMRHRPMVYTLILTYGLMFLLDGLIKYTWGNSPHYIALPGFLEHVVTIGGFRYPLYRMVLLLGIAAVMCGLMLLLNKTRLGMNMRAASDIPEMVSALGVNLRVVRVGAFVLGCVMAGIAGYLAGPLYPILPMMGHEMLISSFVVIVIGGLGSLRGAIIAALLVGVVQTLAEVIITDLAMVIVYMLMALILVFKPLGILGEGKFE